MRTCCGKQKMFYLSLINNFGGGVLWKFVNPVASNAIMQRGVSLLLIKKNAKSRPMSDTSSEELFSKRFQSHSHDPTFSMASVAYDGEHGLEEETND